MHDRRHLALVHACDVVDDRAYVVAIDEHLARLHALENRSDACDVVDKRVGVVESRNWTAADEAPVGQTETHLLEVSFRDGAEKIGDDLLWFAHRPPWPKLARRLRGARGDSVEIFSDALG